MDFDRNGIGSATAQLARFRFELLVPRKAKATSMNAKPFEPTDCCLTVGAMCLYPQRRIVTLLGCVVPLTKREFDVLAVFMNHPSAILEPTQVLACIGVTVPGDVSTNSFERTISTLRKKLAAKASPGTTFIQTVRGLGYKLECSGVAA